MPRLGQNVTTRTAAVTLRPKHGVTARDEARLHHWCHKNCDQYEFYIEYIDEDPDTRHFHGRILLSREKRMDKLKDQIIVALGFIQAEKKVLQKGIKWLYDQWEYAGKDGERWEKSTPIVEEDWCAHYADPRNQYVKKKNSEIQYWLELILPDLPPPEGLTTKEAERLLAPHFANDTLDLPFIPTLKRKIERLVWYYNHQTGSTLTPYIEDTSDSLSPNWD